MLCYFTMSEFVTCNTDFVAVIFTHRCTCKPKSECKIRPCPIGLQRRVRRLATGYPGSCCDQFDCINGMCLVVNIIGLIAVALMVCFLAFDL